MQRPVACLLSAAAVAIIALLSWIVVGAPAASGTHFANGDDAAAVVEGKRIYRQRCASCHGRYLQGQPLWQLLDKDAGRRAPAHDETGHTWQHADEAIFRMTKYGSATMPGFGDALSDSDILAVMAFIKARWPLGLRVSQALLNPGYAGMPADAERVEWRLPPTCNTVLRRARAAAER